MFEPTNDPDADVCEECGVELSDRGRGERAKGSTTHCKECAFMNEQCAYWSAQMPAEFPPSDEEYRAQMIDAGRGHLL